MKSQTQNIWCVGRNYAAHAKEMKAAVPTTPLFFLKSGNCLNPTSKIHLPAWSKDVHHELEIAFLLDESLSFSHVTLALDLTARDTQEVAKKSGQPWTLAKSFKEACPIGSWISILDIKDLHLLSLTLKKNGQVVQYGYVKDMIFNPSELLDFVKTHFPVTAQDVVLTGTPEGVGQVQSGDILEAQLHSEKQLLLTCHWDII